MLCCQLAARKARIKVRCSADATNKLVSEQILYPTGDFFSIIVLASAVAEKVHHDPAQSSVMQHYNGTASQLISSLFEIHAILII